MIIKRKKYIDELLRKKDNGLIKVITGMRRVGKSFILFNLFYNELLKQGIDDEQIIKISLEEYENRKFWNLNTLDLYLQEKIKSSTKRTYILIDEIQFVKSIKDNSGNEITFHHMLMGLMKNADIYVTGSNSKMLSSDIITEFRGRGDEVKIYPLVFGEYVLHNQDKNVQDLWNEYCFFGGLPQLINIKNNDEKSKYLKDLFDLVYLKDILEKNQINNENDILDIMINILASNIGSLTNPLRLSHIFQSEYKTNIHSNTIKKYIDIFKDSFIINEVKRYDVKGNKYINSPQKYYFSDIGIRNARLNFRQIDLQHIIENIIYNELIYRNYNVDVGVIETYQKQENKTIRTNYEIDFVANKMNERIYIQFALNMQSLEKINQEIRGFKYIKDSFKKIIVVNEETQPWLNNSGYKIINIKDFLLNEINF